MFKKKHKDSTSPVPRRRLPEYSIEDGRSPSVQTHNEERQSYRRNQVVSSYKRDDAGDSERQKAHQLVMRRRRISAVFIVAAVATGLLCIGLWQFIAKPAVVFSDVEITQAISAADYEKTISDFVGINPSQRFRVSLDEEALSAFVTSAHSEVSSVSLAGGMSLPSEVRFTIAFRQPVASWQIRNTQYFVDKTGVVFSKNYFSTPVVKVVDESGVTPEQGSSVASSRLLGFLGRVVDQAKGRGYVITEATLPSDTTRRVDILVDGVKPKVHLTTDRGVGVQIEDMDHALKFFTSKGSSPQYIDVRVAGRAAYR